MSLPFKKKRERYTNSTDSSHLTSRERTSERTIEEYANEARDEMNA